MRTITAKPQNKKSKKKILLVLAGFLVFGIFFVFRPVVGVVANLNILRSEARVFKDALNSNDFDTMRSQLPVLREGLAKARKSSLGLLWVRLIPFVGGYYSDFNHSLAAAEHGTVVGDEVFEAIAPFAEILGFETEVEQDDSVQTGDKIAALIRTLPALAPHMGDISSELKIIGEEISDINPKRYPKKFKGLAVRSLLEQAQSGLLSIDEATSDIEKILTLLPEALGDPLPKSYFVIFQNNNEIRPTGGFWTAYSTISFDKGELLEPVSNDIYSIDDRITEEIRPVPEPYAKLLKVEEWYARDANIHPDFKDSVDKFKWFLAKDKSHSPGDGFIAVDTNLVEGLVEVLGKVTVPGYDEEFTADNVIDRLEYYAGQALLGQSGRKNLIGYLMQAIVKEVLNAPQGSWPKFALKTVELLSEKHMLLYLEDPELQALAEKYHAAGRMRDYAGDYLHVNNANLGGAKSNKYIKESVSKVVTKEGDKWVSKITLNYKNPEKDDGWLNTICPLWVRVYVPQGSNLISFSSSTGGEATSGEQYNKTVFETYTVVDPKGSVKLVFEYELPNQVVGDDYRVFIQKQPGTVATPHIVKFEGKSEKFGLNTDKELEF